MKNMTEHIIQVRLLFEETSFAGSGGVVLGKGGGVETVLAVLVADSCESLMTSAKERQSDIPFRHTFVSGVIPSLTNSD